MQHVVQNVGVRLQPGDESLQESDLMERLQDGAGAEVVDPMTERIRLVSLGHNCGPKLSFKHLGRGAETLPFDWGRVRLEGLLHYLRSGFEGFFSFVAMEPVPGVGKMVTYRDYFHSFWHDDPRDQGMQERYCRRIDRFMSIDAEGQEVLFVRAAMATSELDLVDELLGELRARFGRRASLLLILSSQIHAQGAGFVQGNDHLMLYFLELGAHNQKGYVAFSEPTREALDWMVGRPVSGMVFPDVGHAREVASEIQNGFAGLGGLPGFEESPGAAPSPEAVVHAGARGGGD